MWRPKPTTDAHILYGAREIGAYLRVSKRTVIRWYQEHGLPIAHTPGGVMMLSRHLLDQWILSRYRQRMRDRNGSTAS